MDKSSKIFKWDIILLLLCIVFLYTAYSNFTGKIVNESEIFDISSNWELITDEYSVKKINLYDTVDYSGRGNIMIEHEISPDMLKAGKLIFFGQDMAVHAYYDDYEIYRFGSDSTVFKTNVFYGKKWNVIDLPESAEVGKEITLILEPNIPIEVGRLPRIYAAEKTDFFLYLLEQNQPAFLFSFLVLIFGIISISYYEANKKTEGARQGLYIGLFAILSFIWIITKNTWMQFVAEDEVLLKTISFVASSLMSIPLLWFVASIKTFRYKNNVYAMIILLCTYIIAKLLMNIFFGIDVYYNFEIEALAKGTGALYLIFLMYGSFVRSRNKLLGNMILPSIVYFASVVMDIFVGAVNIDRNSTVVAEFGMFACFVLLTIDVVKDMKIAQQKSMWAEMYKLTIDTDALTGLKNQNAFLKYKSEIDVLDNVAVIAVDINDLKQVNDKYGHSKGDFLITSLGEIMRESFDFDFELFRLGGDEFMIASKGHSCEYIESEIREFERNIREFNEGGKDLKLNVAVGYAVFDSTMDKDFQDLVDRADLKMYERKNSMKIG